MFRTHTDGVSCLLIHLLDMYDDLYIVYNRYTYVHEAKRREQQFKRTDFSIEAVDQKRKPTGTVINYAATTIKLKGLFLVIIINNTWDYRRVERSDLSAANSLY